MGKNSIFFVVYSIYILYFIYLVIQVIEPFHFLMLKRRELFATQFSCNRRIIYAFGLLFKLFNSFCVFRRNALFCFQWYRPPYGLILIFFYATTHILMVYMEKLEIMISSDVKEQFSIAYGEGTVIHDYEGQYSSNRQ